MGPLVGWLDGIERRPIARYPGGAYVAQGAGLWKILLHTTEGTSIEGAMAAYRNQSAPPHFTIDLDDEAYGRYVQHIPLTRSAYALRNLRGGTQTNRDHVIQIEIVGYARDTRHWSQRKLLLLAAFLERIMDVVPDVQLHFANFDYADSAEYGIGNTVEMSAGEWDAFSGILGHVHAPENTHWDPGALNTAALLALMTEGVQGDMSLFQKINDPDTRREWVAVESEGVPYVREFSSYRGQGDQVNGLGYVIDDFVDAGVVKRVLKGGTVR